jgi:hypothetical protein
MTVWGDDEDKELALQHNVQIEIGCDSTDLWLAFNKKTAAVQMTHEDARILIKEMEEALARIQVVETTEVEKEE